MISPSRSHRFLRVLQILGHSLPQDWVLESFSDAFSWNDSTECVDTDGSLQDVRCRIYSLCAALFLMSALQVVSLDVDGVDDISGSDDDASMGEVCLCVACLCACFTFSFFSQVNSFDEIGRAHV